MATASGNKESLLEAIGAKVKSLRNESHLTIKDLAERSGLSVRFIAQLEAGQGNISIARLADVASALGKPVQGLIPPANSDGSIHSEIWREINRCNEEELLEFRDWLAHRAGEKSPRFIALVGLRGAGKSTVG